MFLKRLELHGFKSFGKKVQLEFERGVTAIVGPNGSGKSNIADGVRWVLGEQSARSLRGNTMQDVIFAGSDGKGPLGMAEVSLTLGGCEKKLDLGFDEVTVTRRLYRSGESQYLINKTQCRLKDILDLFRDTGLGREGYSLVGQGQIDAILQARPEERRLIIEEAAGIGKYRTRKAEAVKKLAATQGKVERLKDILGELERQLGPLVESAAKAEVFLTLRTKYEQKGRDLCAFQWAALNTQDKKLEREQSAFTNELNHLEKAQKREDVRAFQLKQRILEVEKNLEELDTSLKIKTDQKEEMQTQLIQARERASYMQTERNRLQLEKQKTSLHRTETRRALARKVWEKRSLNTMLKETARKMAKLAGLKEANQQKRRNFADELKEIEQKKAGIRQEIASLQADLQANQSRESLWKEQLQALSHRQNEVARQLNTFTRMVEEHKTAVRNGQAKKLVLKEKCEQVQENAKVLQKAWTKQEDAVGKIREALRAKRSRLEALTALERDYAGYYDGVRKVLQNRKLFTGICGVVAELIEVPAELAVAIEVILGSALQNIVTENDVGPLQAVNYLKKHRAGRATFLPLDGLRFSPFPQRLIPLLDQKNVLGLGKDLVGYSAKYQRLADYLLGRVIVTADLDTAALLSRKLGGGYRIVTLEGDTISAGGAITGGSSPQRERTGLLRRRQEVSSLARDIKNQEKILAGETQSALQLQKDTKLQTDMLSDMQEELQKLNQKIQDRRQAAVLLEEEFHSWERENTHIKQEVEELQHKIAEGSKVQSFDVSTIDALIAQEADWQNRAQDLEKELQSILADDADHTELFTNSKIAVATTKSQLQGLDQDILRYRKTLDEISEELCRLEKSEETVIENERALYESTQDAECVLAGLEEKIRQCRQQMVEAGARRKEMEQNVADAQDSFRDKQAAKEELQKKMNQNLRALDKIAATKSQIEEALVNEYGVEEDAAAKTLSWLDRKGEQRTTAEVDELKQKIRNLRNKLQDLGPVNLQAVEECVAVQERYDFLKKQQADLLEAKQQLHVVIEDMDEVSKTKFSETFREVQREFQSIFVKLFGGGAAKLHLSEAEKAEEAGLEISIRLPGKRMQNMNLLSGGERALTAISLQFALLRVKPSPFCVLDEIDATLDEGNLGRFAKLLSEFAQDTQLIMITHRLGSMEAADILYGVTMNRENISQLVAVQLEAAAAVLGE
ncbi:MAG: chromosome segregation protein SMC [Firmicutes bacterium]|nr:chromosome segregation protein SMC [Bacillota bacterium]